MAEAVSTIVDRIYEAAFIPQMWPGVLQSLAELSNSAAAILFVFDERSPPEFVSTDLISPLLQHFKSTVGWPTGGKLRRLLATMPTAAFIHDEDFFPPDGFEGDHARQRRRIAGPLGIGGQVGLAIPLPTGEVVMFSLERWLDKGRLAPEDIARLDGLRPHLSRAGLIAARLRLAQARATVAALNAMGLPAAVMQASGRVMASNDLLDRMSGVFLSTAHGRMALADMPANLLFGGALAGHRHESAVRSIPIPAREGRQALIVHLLPLRGTARDIFSGGDILVAATRPAPGALVPSAGILTGLFDLTPAEAKLAAALASGLPLAAAAAANGITVKSARIYLERIFRKTGTHQQSQLVALLKTAHPFPAG